MLVRPQHCTIQIIQKSVTIWSEKRHPARCIDKSCLQVVITGFGKARGKTDTATAAHFGKAARHLDHRMAVDSQKGGIRCCGQCGKAVIAGDASHFGTVRMYWPDLAVKP